MRPVSRRLLRAVAIVGLLGLISFAVFCIGLEVWAEYQVRATHKALERQDYNSAWDHVTKALKVRKKSAELHLLAARVARQGGQLDEADDLLTRTFQLQGGTSEQLQLERLMLLAQSGQVQEVYERLFAYVASDEPEAPLVLEALTVGFLREQLASPAIICAEIWLQKEPNNVQALIYHAVCAVATGSSPIAVEDIEQALERAPERPELRQVMAGVYTQANEYSKAMDLYDELLQNKPEDDDVLLGAAKCKFGLANFDECKVLLDRLIDKNPENTDALALRGKLALFMENAVDAERWNRKALAIDPNHHEASYNLEQCLLSQGKLEEAEEEARNRKAIEADMNRVQDLLMNHLARPTMPRAEVYHELGEILLRRGQTEMGIFWLYKALGRDPAYQPTHKVLVSYYEKKGDKTAAASHRRLLKEKALPPGVK